MSGGKPKDPEGHRRKSTGRKKRGHRHWRRLLNRGIRDTLRGSGK